MASVVRSRAVRARYFSLDNICSNLNQVRLMKIQQSHLNIILIFAGAAAALFLAGCAEMQSGNTTSLLIAADFIARTPQTAQQKQIYAALPPYQVQRATVKGKGIFYVYKDEKAGLAYVGREQEYQRYQRLAIAQQIAQDRYMAAEMELRPPGPLVRSMRPAGVLVVIA